MKLIKKENGDYHLLSNNEIKSLQEFNITKEDCDILTLGYSVEKMALQDFKDNDDGFISFQDRSNGFVAGFEAHQELVKDKLFTVDDMRKAFREGLSYTTHKHYHSFSEDVFIESLLPKTEWDIEIIDNKIKLL